MIKEGPFLKIINKIQKDKPEFNKKSKEALLWYKKKVGSLIRGKKDPRTIYEQNSKKPLRVEGQLLTFVYDAKGKKELPYFDKYPLCLVLSLNKGGFTGLNFHYLSPLDRAIFMDSLYKYFVAGEERGVVAIDYEMLIRGGAKFKFHKACIKQYRYDCMSSSVSIISPDLWDLALFIPSENFVSFTGNSTNRDQIYEDSKQLYKK